MSSIRPLPSKPNLEFEHKQAKALLRLLRAGDVDAFARAQQTIDVSNPAQCKLADAQLIIAREYGFPSWKRLVSYYQDFKRQQADEWARDPLFYAGRALKERDLETFQLLVQMHPEWRNPSTEDQRSGRTLLAMALHHERQQGLDALRPIMAWLEHEGFDVQLELNRQLCGHMNISAEKVRWLLARGADPAWIAPNGISVLEHALIRYWSGDVVDILAERITPRHALWIAAGLGDVDVVSQFLDVAGKPVPAARDSRPDFKAAGQAGVPSNHDAGDEEILLEAFFIAMLNQRINVLEYMLSRGFPIDTMTWKTPLVFLAVGNGWLAVAECLIHHGADVDLKGLHPDMSARDVARYMIEQGPVDETRRRLAELCGLDADLIVAEQKANAKVPVADPALEEALTLANDDALRLGQSEVRPENLIFGLLRAGGLPFMFITRYAHLDLDRFRADVRQRVRAADDRMKGPTLPLDETAQAAIDGAFKAASERRREIANGLHLLYAVAKHDEGGAAALLQSYGASMKAMRETIEKAL